MNVLPFNKQVRVIAALVDGCSIRATERMTDVHRDTVMRLGLTVGEGCQLLHDALMVDLQVPILELDEIWSFVGKKQGRLRPGDRAELGDQYTFIGLDANKKAIISFRTGKRDGDTAHDFAHDLRARVLGRPQITTDGFVPYLDAIAEAFGEDADYAMLIKQYGVAEEEEERRYGPPRCIGVETKVVSGQPDPDRISTSYIERQNLTLRMGCRRLTRLTNAYSKRVRNHCAAVALYVAHYNFCRVHETIKTTPARALGVADHTWSVAELIEAALSMAPAPEPPPLPPLALPSAPRPRAPIALPPGGHAQEGDHAQG